MHLWPRGAVRLDKLVERWSEHRAFPVDDCLADRVGIARALAVGRPMSNRLDAWAPAFAAGRWKED